MESGTCVRCQKPNLSLDKDGLCVNCDPYVLDLIAKRKARKIEPLDLKEAEGIRLFAQDGGATSSPLLGITVRNDGDNQMAQIQLDTRQVKQLYELLGAFLEKHR